MTNLIAPTLNFKTRMSVFAGDIKIAHTVFALPWAMLAVAVAARAHPGSLSFGKIGLILICMATARTVAMSANRLLDARLDAQNPRTARRAIPSGALSIRFYAIMLALCAGAFIAGAAGFLHYGNRWPLALSLPVLLFVSAYPLLKRFTRLCHYYLGAALGLAPLCAWLALTGQINSPPIFMALAVTSWTAGFDIIYACQDYQSDVALGIFSVPAKFGISGALWIGRLTHVFSVAMMLLVWKHAACLHELYLLGVAIAAVLLIVEHALVKPTNLARINLAFFTINGIISLVVGALGITDAMLHL